MKVSLSDVIVRSRRRLLRNALAVAGARTTCAGVGGLVLLLFVGTEALDWRWLAAFPLLTFAAGVILVWRRRPTAYDTAQLLDARLHLADTLSTAVFYWPRQAWVKCHEGMRRGQRDYATRVAAGVNIRAALPLRIPRPVTSCLTALALLAVGLAVIRYRSEGRLDLRDPALPGLRQWIRNIGPELTRLERYASRLEDDRHTGFASRDDAAAQKSSGPDSSEARPSTDGEAVPQSGELAAKSKAPATRAGSQTTGEQTADRQQQDTDEDTEPRDNGGARSGDAQSSRDAGQPGTGSGLLAKLSNSLANLTSALKSQLAHSQDAKSAQDGASNRNSGNAKAPGNGVPASHGTPEAGTRGEGAAGDFSASDTGRDGANGRSSNPDRREGSGAGSDDGSKQIQLAKQLEAMGKISVILGKRSQTVNGSATVEVNSGRAALTTPYRARQASHGAVISAEQDRIPIEFETYIQQYFRELRKHSGRR